MLINKNCIQLIQYLTIVFFPLVVEAQIVPPCNFDIANYPSGDRPESVAIGDFNGDTDLDIATANVDSSNISIFLNNGDGTFASQVSYPSGNRPRSISIGDLDSNSTLDLVVANDGSGNVSVFLGKGNGEFADHVLYAAGNGPRNAQLCDLDGDTDLDLAVPNASSDNFSVHLNNGDGSFATALFYEAGDSPINVSGGDLDNDGDCDIVIPNINDATISVMLNNGDGTFASQVVFAVGSRPFSVDNGELDGDSFTDLVVSNGNNFGISVLRGNGDGTFQAPIVYTDGSITHVVALGDLNGDSLLDIAGGSTSTDCVAILFGVGDGTFTFSDAINTGDGAFGVAIGDFDGDVDLDLAVSNILSNTVSILLNESCEPFLEIANLEFNVDGVLPSSMDNIEFFTNGASEDAAFSVSNGYLRQRTFSVDGNHSYASPNGAQTGGNLSSTLSTLVEARLRVASINSNDQTIGGHGAYFQAVDGVNEYGLFFTETGVNLRKNDGSLEDIPLDHSTFRTYQIFSPANSDQELLFVDGQHLATVDSVAVGQNGFAFGDGFSLPGNGADVDWDYLRISQSDMTIEELPIPVKMQIDAPGNLPDYDSSLMAFDEGGVLRPLDFPDVFCATRPTIVLTHGLNSSPDIFAAFDMDSGHPNLAAALKQTSSHPAFPDGVNVLAWDWTSGANVTACPILSDVCDLLVWGIAGQNAVREGRRLGQDLGDELGQDYKLPIHFIGHSFGARANKNAVEVLVSSDKRFQYDPLQIHITNLDGAEYTPFQVENPNYIPIPSCNQCKFRYIDNYVTSFAGLHREAANFLLFDNNNDFGFFCSNAIAFHSFPIDWYRDTVLDPKNDDVGHAISFERGTIDSGPMPDSYKTLQDNGVFLTIDDGTAFDLIAARQVKFGLCIGGPVTLVGAGSVIGIAKVGAVSLVPIISTLPITGGFVGIFIGSILLEASSPAYVELTLELPENPSLLSLNLLPSNLTSDDVVTVSVENEIQFQARGDELAHSMLNGQIYLGLADYAGQQVKVFIGLDSAGGAGQTLEIQNLSLLSTLETIPGDVDGDGEVNLLDVFPFVNLLIVGDYLPQADANFDGSLDLLDITPFVEILSGG